MTGEVVEVDGERTRLAVVGSNDRGAHVTAHVVVVPSGSAR
jgi:hypothetical protein